MFILERMYLQARAPILNEMPYRKLDREQFARKRARILREDANELPGDAQLRRFMVRFEVVSHAIGQLLQRELIEE